MRSKEDRNLENGVHIIVKTNVKHVFTKSGLYKKFILIRIYTKNKYDFYSFEKVTKVNMHTQNFSFRILKLFSIAAYYLHSNAPMQALSKQ